jgi:hypothetical protein
MQHISCDINLQLYPLCETRPLNSEENSEISGSHDGVYEDNSLLEYCAVHSLIALMMETVSTSETSVNFDETTRRNIPEGCLLLKKNISQHTTYIQLQWLVTAKILGLLGFNGNADDTF